MRTLDVQWPVARKQHACTMCGQPIYAHTCYVRWLVADGPHLLVGKAHLVCDAAWRDLLQAGWAFEDDPLPDPGTFTSEVLGPYVHAHPAEVRRLKRSERSEAQGDDG